MAASGISVAQTTGGLAKVFSNLKGRQKDCGTPSRGADELSLLSGGLRYATTTGYYLTAFQAEIPRLKVAIKP